MASGGGYDICVAAVIDVQQIALRLGIGCEEVAQAFRRRPAEAVNGLVVVPDCHNVVLRRRQEFGQLALDTAAVLVFVDQDVFEAFLPDFQDGGLFVKEFAAPQQHIVKVQPAAAFQQLLVSAVQGGKFSLRAA